MAACVPRTLTSVPGVHTVRSTLRTARACTRTWGENVRTFVQTHQATFAGVCGRACGQLCGQLCGRVCRQGEGGGAAQRRPGIWILGLASHFSHWPARRGRASPANVKSGWPGPISKCQVCVGPPHRPRPACTRARTIARTTARTHARTRPQTWPGAFAQMSARFHPRYACKRVRYGGWSELCAPQVR